MYIYIYYSPVNSDDSVCTTYVKVIEFIPAVWPYYIVLELNDYNPCFGVGRSKFFSALNHY